MEEYITIKRENFDSLKSKAEKYDIGELSDEMHAEYKLLKKQVEYYNKKFSVDLNYKMYILQTLRHISYCLHHDKTFLSSSDFDSLAMFIGDVVGVSSKEIDKSIFDYSNIDGIKRGLLEAQKYISNNLFISKMNKKKLSDLLDNLFYLAIGKFEKTI